MDQKDRRISAKRLELATRRELILKYKLKPHPDIEVLQATEKKNIVMHIRNLERTLHELQKNLLEISSKQPW